MESIPWTTDSFYRGLKMAPYADFMEMEPKNLSLFVLMMILLMESTPWATDSFYHGPMMAQSVDGIQMERESPPLFARTTTD